MLTVLSVPATGELCKTQLQPEKRDVQGGDLSLPAMPAHSPSEPALHEHSWLRLQHTPRTGQMLSPRSHMEPPVDQSTEPSHHLSPLQPEQPYSLCACISHSDFSLPSFSKGSIAISISHPLGETQRTKAEQQPLTPSETSLVFVALYLLLFSKGREKQTM